MIDNKNMQLYKFTIITQVTSKCIHICLLKILTVLQNCKEIDTRIRIFMFQFIKLRL